MKSSQSTYKDKMRITCKNYNLLKKKNIYFTFKYLIEKQYTF